MAHRVLYPEISLLALTNDVADAFPFLMMCPHNVELFATNIDIDRAPLPKAEHAYKASLSSPNEPPPPRWASPTCA
jgi:hypothetical protein